MDTIVGIVMFLILAALVCLAGYGVYRDITAERFSLRKDEWTCTASHVETTYYTQKIGDVDVQLPMTATVCDQLNRRR